jgi:hypothetical protein
MMKQTAACSGVSLWLCYPVFADGLGAAIFIRRECQSSSMSLTSTAPRPLDGNAR